jgi:hypothetical protein
MGSLLIPSNLTAYIIHIILIRFQRVDDDLTATGWFIAAVPAKNEETANDGGRVAEP